MDVSSHERVVLNGRYAGLRQPSVPSSLNVGGEYSGSFSHMLSPPTIHTSKQHAQMFLRIRGVHSLFVSWLRHMLPAAFT